jgi:hypothetical protein
MFAQTQHNRPKAASATVSVTSCRVNSAFLVRRATIGKLISALAMDASTTPLPANPGCNCPFATMFAAVAVCWRCSPARPVGLFREIQIFLGAARRASRPTELAETAPQNSPRASAKPAIPDESVSPHLPRAPANAAPDSEPLNHCHTAFSAAAKRIPAFVSCS